MSSTADPFLLFREWHRDARAAGGSGADAVCLGTVDSLGMPNARFVELRDVTPEGLVFGTHLASRKARELEVNPGATLTFWWTAIRKQVRIVGRASRISDAAADRVFAQRSRDARITSWAATQSAPMVDPVAFLRNLEEVRQRFREADVPRPPDWGGFVVAPDRIEFLSFQEDRMHDRLLFERVGADWRVSRLQP